MSWADAKCFTTISTGRCHCLKQEGVLGQENYFRGTNSLSMFASFKAPVLTISSATFFAFRAEENMSESGSFFLDEHKTENHDVHVQCVQIDA
jgi:hypothetical protein